MKGNIKKTFYIENKNKIEKSCFFKIKRCYVYKVN